MELHPSTPLLTESLRAGSAIDLTAGSVTEVRPPVTPRLPTNRLAPVLAAEEDLVPDQRADLTPAQSVERKLSVLLRGGSIPVSHLRMAKLCRRA
jgi:hypothetical protein